MSEQLSAASFYDDSLSQFESRGINPQLIATLCSYLNSPRSLKTLKAYDADWRRYCAWCESVSFKPLPPDPKVVALYLVACASGHASVGGKPFAISTIERRLVALVRTFAEAGFTLDKSDYLKKVVAGIRGGRQSADQPNSTDVDLPKIARLTRRRVQALLRGEGSAVGRNSGQQKERPNLTEGLGL